MQEIEVTVIEDVITNIRPSSYADRETLTSSYVFVDCQDIGGESALVQAVKFAKRQVRRGTTVTLKNERDECVFSSRGFTKIPEAKTYLTNMVKGA